MANDNRFTWLDGYELSHVARNDANDNVNDADGDGDDHHLDTVTPHNQAGTIGSGAKSMAKRTCRGWVVGGPLCHSVMFLCNFVEDQTGNRTISHH